jgi:hypothetical protein
VVANLPNSPGEKEEGTGFEGACVDEEWEVVDEWVEDSDKRSLFGTARGREETARQAVALRGDDIGGTSKQRFSFLVPSNGTKDLSNRPEIVLLPHRQPRNGGCPGADTDPCGVRVAMVPDVPVVATGGNTADSLASCVEMKVTTRCRSAADSLRL